MTINSGLCRGNRSTQKNIRRLNKTKRHRKKYSTQ